MGTLIKVDGSETPYSDFELSAMQKAVGGYIQIIPIGDGKIMILDEEGKIKNKVHNEKATFMAISHLFDNDYIAGDAIVAMDEDVK